MSSPDSGIDVERLADWMMENLPRLHRWMMVGWRNTMRDEAVALASEMVEYARLSTPRTETGDGLLDAERDALL